MAELLSTRNTTYRRTIIMRETGSESEKKKADHLRVADVSLEKILATLSDGNIIVKDSSYVTWMPDNRKSGDVRLSIKTPQPAGTHATKYNLRFIDATVSIISEYEETQGTAQYHGVQIDIHAETERSLVSVCSILSLLYSAVLPPKQSKQQTLFSQE